MRRARTVAAALVLTAVGCSDGDDDDGCKPGDQDGIIGGDYTFDLAIDDTTFTPIILKTQNNANVTLTLVNNGLTSHDFTIDCLATPSDNGCPTTSCFSAASTIAPLAPGASTTVTFATPAVEGIYTFRSDVAGDAQTGQFVIQ